MTDANLRRLLNRWIYVLVKVDSEFLLPYTTNSQERIRTTGGYGHLFEPFLDRFMQTLFTEGWQPGTYYPAGWWRSHVAEGLAPGQLRITRPSFEPFYQEEFRVEADGTWRVGEKQVEGNVLSFFLRHLEFDGEIERYRVRYWLENYYETRYLHHLSPPLRVCRVVSSPAAQELVLNDGTVEALRPDTLRMDKQERLYCGIRSAGLPALFEKNARWQLLHQVEEQGDGWVLCTAQGEEPLQLDGPLDFPGGLGGSPDTSIDET